MSWIKPEVAGVIIIRLIQVGFTIFTIVIAMEYLGFSGSLLRNYEENDLRGGKALFKSEYYPKKYLEDPYGPFQELNLHPYYLFSLPWRKADILAKNSDIVHINESGFRRNPMNTLSGDPDLILLGGSTAFGHFASNDSHTIAARLSSILKLNVINRNAPSWNSHQEMVALARYQDKFSVSISFSLSNDINNSCNNKSDFSDGEDYLESPEGFSDLLSLSNSQYKIKLPEYTSPKAFIKDVLFQIVPDTSKVYFFYKEEFLNKYTDYESPHIYDQIYAKPGKHSCALEPQQIVESFVKNQKTMAQLSKARGARHITVLQPHLDLLGKSTDAFKFKRAVYDGVMRSDYCKKSYCLDLSLTINDSPINLLFDRTNIDTAIFVDPVHLLDIGANLYSEAIAVYLVTEKLVSIK